MLEDKAHVFLWLHVHVIWLDSSSSTKVMKYYLEIIIRKIEISMQKDKENIHFLEWYPI